jgi:ABC-type lipoprotein release transport system permease subunit
MQLYLRLAWRNIWRHRRRTLIVVLAIGLSMALMMMYDGLMAGFNEAIYANAIKVMGGNIQVHAAGYRDQMDETPLMPLESDQAVLDAALAQPQVEMAARRVNTGGMATSREGAFSVAITGIEPEKEGPVSLIAQNVIEGSYLSADDLDVILIGKGLAEAMDVGVGDRITLVGRATHEQMRQRTMTIGGIYDLRMPEIEKRSVYMALGEAQDLYGLDGQATEVAITLKQLGTEPAVVKAMAPSLPGYEVDSWEESYPELRQAVNSKGKVMDIFSVIILFIAGIGILNLMLMAVFERTREIGLLGALGMKPRQISSLFLLEGTLMGLVGLIFGVALGLLSNYLFSLVGFDYGQFSSVTEYTALISGRIYPTLGTDKLVQRSVTALAIAVLFSIYPAREAANKEPAIALHTV